MPRQRTQQKITGYGKKLAAAMRRARLTQLELAKEASISRQTLSKALRADEVSPRTERQIAATLTRLIGAESGLGTTSGDPTDAADRSGGLNDRATRRRPTRLANLIDATELTKWADRRTAQAELPQLIRRLILSTPQSLTVAFRAGEGVQMSGWDGVVVARTGDAFVPAGQSVWELGVSKGSKGKADSDYEKRSAAPGDIDPAITTFVFVTLRRWRDKDAWAKRRRAEKKWFDVRAYDADDLETWIERAPTVHLWLSSLLGAPVEGVADLQAARDQWAKATVPVLTAEFVLAGRANVVSAIVAWLEDPRSPLILRAESREEALAVFVASVIAGSPATSEAQMARALAVYDSATWRRLIAAQEPLILVPLFDAGDLASAAARAGHAVVVPISQEEPELQGDGIDVSPIDIRLATSALTATGIAEDLASEYAALGRRSMMALRRQIAATPAGRQPAWAQPSDGRSILPAMFAARWTEASSGDRETVQLLGRAPYDEIRDRLLKWSDRPDPPLRRREANWFLVSAQDSWRLLSRYLVHDDLERFRPVAIQVLSDLDPRYGLPVEQRWMANVLGKVPQYSTLLRQGIAQTLAIMGVGGADVTHPNNELVNVSSGIVRSVLEAANTDWRLWASLEDVLSSLAEAAPDEFLDAVERGTDGDEPILANLFTDQESSPFSTSPHVHLLWALENLGWSPQFLGRVANLLARLTEIDPGGKTMNRPEASLYSLFRPWYPQTTASVDQRSRVIDGIRRRHSDIAWRLLRAMLPQLHGSAINNPRPKWRDWASNAPTRASRLDYMHAVDAAVQMLHAMVGRSGQRWADLVEALPRLDVSNRDMLLTELNANVPTMDHADQIAVWDALRSLVSQHRSFPNAAWVMPSDAIDAIDAVRMRLEPRDGLDRFKWLFTQRPDLPEGRDTGPGRFDAYQQAVDARRIDAVRQVYALDGLDGLLKLAAMVKIPELIGRAAANLTELHQVEDELLHTHLAGEVDAYARLASAFADARIRSSGAEWVERKLTELVPPLLPMQRVQLLRLLPPTPATWSLALHEGETVDAGYWDVVQVYDLPDVDTEILVRKLLDRRRVFAAIEFLAHTTAPCDRTLVYEAFDALVDTKAVDQPSPSFGYDAAKLLDAIATDMNATSDDISRVAQLEWTLLPVVGEYERSPRALHQALASTPSFFVDIVSLVFSGDRDGDKQEKDAITDDDRERARRGYALLQSWRRLPGQRDDDDTVAPTELMTWVTTARQNLADAHRLAIGDELIGQMLSGSPLDPDGGWPAVAVRDVIEDVKSPALDRGIAIGVYNSRGVVTRPIGGGGAEERGLAERYEGYAALVSDTWPRTAALLRNMADSYRSDAAREDHRAALDDDLGL